MKMTHIERIAQDLGYPSSLFGLTPNERSYWVEPAMPWVLPLLNPQHYGLDPVACVEELTGLMAFHVWNENMAPRFAHGTYLAGRPLAWGQEVAVGEVLAWLAPNDALDCFYLARVVEVGANLLRLAYDNGGHTHTFPWHHTDPARLAYRITHYVTQPTTR
jgi:hypothetical protein